jgi:hypothetical protein
MDTLQISGELAETIQSEAAVRGLTVENFLRSVILRERTLANRCKIEQEQDWWLSLPLSERAKYQGEFVAVHNKELIDHGKDENALHKRIRAKYGNTPILIMPAEGPREVRILSPHLVQE